MKMFKKALCVLAISGMVGVSVSNLSAAGEEDERADRGKVLLKMLVAQLPSGLILQLFGNMGAVDSLAQTFGVSQRTALYMIQSTALSAGVFSNALAGQISWQEASTLGKLVPMVSVAGVLATRKWFNDALSYIPGYGKIFLCPSKKCEGICMECLIPRAVEFAAIYSIELYAKKELMKWWSADSGASRREAVRREP